MHERGNPLTPQEQRTAFWGVVAGLGGAVVVALALRASGSPETAAAPPAPKPLPHDPKTWEAEVDAQAAILEQLLGWPGLGTFLKGVAWTESRGNTNACYGSCGTNSARGRFGLRPASSRVSEFGPSDLLYDPRWSMALAAWYAARLRANWSAPQQDVDWLALRRGWALPRLVDDVNETEYVEGWGYGGRSKHSRKNLEEGLINTGTDPSFMYQKAFPPSYNWPGNPDSASSVLPLLEALGLIPKSNPRRFAA